MLHCLTSHVSPFRPSHGVLPGPLLGQLLVLLLVSLVQSEVKLTNSNLVFEVSDVSLVSHLAISGTRGSSGLGSQSNEQIERSTLEMVRAGDH